MDEDWRKSLAQSIGLAKAEQSLTKARWNFKLARLIARVNPMMRSCVEETRKSLDFWTLMVADLRGT
jgi:hypothetical protein